MARRRSSADDRTHAGPLPQPDRPRMPSSYGVDRAAVEGLLPWSFVDERMTASRNYWVATASPDARPHVAPVWGVWLEDTFYFSTDRSSRKGRNLAANPEVVVHLESGDEAVILAGVVEELSLDPVLGRFADAYEEKYGFRPDVRGPAPGVYRLRAHVVHAWREAEFPTTATRWVITPR